MDINRISKALSDVQHAAGLVQAEELHTFVEAVEDFCAEAKSMLCELAMDLNDRESPR